jgi:hypothetical protein
MSKVEAVEKKRGKQSAPFMTRKQMAEYIRQEHGVPVKHSSIEKLAAQGRLKADKFYGKCELYTPQTADTFVENELLSDRRLSLRLKPAVENKTSNEVA